MADFASERHLPRPNIRLKARRVGEFRPEGASGALGTRSPRTIHGTIRRHPVGLVDSQLIELQLFGPRRAACTD